MPIEIAFDKWIPNLFLLLGPAHEQLWALPFYGYFDSFISAWVNEWMNSSQLAYQSELYFWILLQIRIQPVSSPKDYDLFIAISSEARVKLFWLYIVEVIGSKISVFSNLYLKLL